MIKRINKHGQFGMDIAKKFLIGLVIVMVLLIVAVIIFGQFQQTNIFPDGSHFQNQTEAVAGNGTAAVLTFATNATTWLVMLSIAILIIIIGLAIFFVSRFGKG